MDALTAAIEALVGAKLAAKVCAFLGGLFIVFGWLRGKGGRAAGRALLALSDEESEKRLQAFDSRLDSIEVAVARLEARMDWRDKSRVR